MLAIRDAALFFGLGVAIALTATWDFLLVMAFFNL